MANYIVEIKDMKGVSFKIALTLTTSFSGLSGVGTWRSKADGFIRYSSGDADREKSSGRMTTKDVYLCRADATWGIRLNEFHNWIGAFDEGSGVLMQPWALAITPGKISWKVIN